MQLLNYVKHGEKQIEVWWLHTDRSVQLVVEFTHQQIRHQFILRSTMLIIHWIHSLAYMQRNIQYGTLLKSYTRPEGSPPKKITVLRLAQDLEWDANHSEVPQLLHPSEESLSKLLNPKYPRVIHVDLKCAACLLWSWISNMSQAGAMCFTAAF